MKKTYREKRLESLRKQANREAGFRVEKEAYKGSPRLGFKKAASKLRPEPSITVLPKGLYN